MRTILFLTFAYLSIANTIAQMYYYDVTKTFKEQGYTYQCDVPSYGTVTLYNKENKLTYTDVIYKSSGEIYSPEPWEHIPLFENNSWTKDKCYSIVNNAFSTIEKQRIKDFKLMTTLCISPDTGKVLEVNFSFIDTSPFATIPVSIYRKIETEIKSQVWFNITAEGKKLNYIMLFWRQKVK